MDEAEWLTCTDPQQMMQSLQCTASRRKLRLFAVACCRSVWHIFTDQRARDVIEIAELHADGMACECWLKGVWQALVESWPPPRAMPCYRLVRALATERGYPHPIVERIQELVLEAANDNGAARRAPAGEEVQAARTAWLAAVKVRDSVREVQSSLLRDMFGNPFRPVTFAAAWRTPTVTALAKAAYEDRQPPASILYPDRLAVIADALEDAGCTDTAILDHCRDGGLHVRGCWVVDLLLGKS